jgi:hypothetical protein
VRNMKSHVKKVCFKGQRRAVVSWALASRALLPESYELAVHFVLSVHQYCNDVYVLCDRLCGLVVRVLGYRSGGPGSIHGTTRKKK